MCQRGSLAREIATDADTFQISFPGQASPEDRALLFTALFMVDFLLFENNQRAQQ